MKLEDIAAGNVLTGVVPGKLATVVAAEMRGADALELAYRVEGVLGQRRLSRADEDGLLLASKSIWPSKLDPRLAAVLAVLLAALVLWQLFPRSGVKTGGATDIPVIIRTKGGLLEVATLKHRRTFNLTQVLFVAGIKVPFCRATASYTVDTYITYRVRLAKDWAARYRNERLELTAPRLEPALPVAFDTSRLQSTMQKCPMMSDRIKLDLLQRISGKLAEDAQNPANVDMARNGGARATVGEFARKWLLSQKDYDIPTNTPIDVRFDDE